MLSAAAALVLSSISLPTLATEPTKDDCSISGSCELIVKAQVAEQCSCSFEGYYPTLDIGKLNKYDALYGGATPYEDQKLTISCNTEYGGSLSAESLYDGLTGGGGAYDIIDYKLYVNGNNHGLASGDFPYDFTYTNYVYNVSVMTEMYDFEYVPPGMKYDTITFTISPI